MQESNAKVNNERHQAALDIVKDFKAKGGKIQKFGVTRGKGAYKVPKPKRFIKIADQVRVT